MRVERRVDPVPEAGSRRHGLAAPALDGQRRRDLVRGAAEDDDGAGQLVPQVGQREGSRHDARGDRVVAARVDRLDRAVRPEHRHGVVEGDQADRWTSTPPGEGRAERGAHSGDAELDVQPALLQDVAEVARTFALLVRELRMLVDEAMRRERGVPLRLDSREDLLVVYGVILSCRTRRKRARPSDASTSRRAGIGFVDVGAAGADSTVASFPPRQSANCAVSRDATSPTTPRPYWATAPRSASSVTISTRVPSS